MGTGGADRLTLNFAGALELQFQPHDSGLGYQEVLTKEEDESQFDAE